MRSFTLLPSLALVLLASVASEVGAQVTRSGLLIYKDTPFTADEFATVTEFASLAIFQTVHNLVTADGSKLSILTGLVVARVDYEPILPSAFPNILQESDLAPAKAEIQNLDELARRYPAARKYLAPFAFELKREKERFEKGQGKWNGQWYAAREAAVEERNRPMRLAAAERAKQEAVDKAETERTAAEAKMRAATMEAEEKVRAAALEAAAMAEKAKAQEFNSQISALLKRVVAEKVWTEPAKELTKIQPVSKELLREVERANDRWKVLQQEIKLADARRACEADVPGLEAVIAWSHAAQLFAESEAPQAATILRDFLARYSAATNPELTPIWDRLVDISSICRQQEEEAQVHLRKAEQLVAAGKNSLGIGEYQTALSLFPDSRIATQISQLRKTSLGL